MVYVGVSFDERCISTTGGAVAAARRAGQPRGNEENQTAQERLHHGGIDRPFCRGPDLTNNAALLLQRPLPPQRHGFRVPTGPPSGTLQKEASNPATSFAAPVI